jgi:hypothetical protein
MGAASAVNTRTCGPALRAVKAWMHGTPIGRL